MELQELQENVVSDDSNETSTQDETKINNEKDEKFTHVNKIVVSSNPFYNLIESQAKEFEEFGKRMSLGLQRTYEEYEIQQKGGTKIGIDSIGMERIYKKFEEKFAIQSKLIDSLRARVEELETDSIIKGQKIKKLEGEVSNYKGNRSVPPAPRDNKKKSVYSDKNENDKNLETQRPDGKQKQNVKIPQSKILKPVVKVPVQNQDNISTTTDDKDENEDDDMFVYRDTFNMNTNKNKNTNTESYNNLDKESFEYNGKDRRVGDDEEHEEYYGNYAGPPTIYFQYNEDDYDDDFNEEKGNYSNPSTSYQQQYSEYNDEIYNDNYSYYGNSQHSQQYEQFEQYDEREGNEQQGRIYYNSQGANNNNNNQQDSSNRRRPPRNNRRQRRSAIIYRIHHEIVDQKNAKHLLNKFSVSQLLEFERSHLYRSLESGDKNSLRNTVHDGLRIELTGIRKLTQPIEVYVNRKLIPPLPPGISSYAEFKTTSHYDALPNEKKKRLQKIN